jgi:hypothetical protein
VKFSAAPRLVARALARTTVIASSVRVENSVGE